MDIACKNITTLIAIISIIARSSLIPLFSEVPYVRSSSFLDFFTKIHDRFGWKDPYGGQSLLTKNGKQIMCISFLTILFNLPYLIYLI